MDVNPSKPRVYVHESGQKYINIFTGYLYPNPPPHDSYDKNVKSCVATILRHIQMVLCSNKKEQMEYMFGLSFLEVAEITYRWIPHENSFQN